MELTKIKGNTYYINAPTNIGVYSYKNKNCLLIDTGINNSAARKIEEVLNESNLHVKHIINTHSHTDHCGGNTYFKNKYSGCITYASAKEKVYMENIELRSTMMYTSHPVKELVEECRDVNVDFVLDYGTVKINDEKFEVVALKGHSPESIGFVTSDKVCFLGDAIYSDGILDKYSFPYIFNVEDNLRTLEKIKEIDADFYVMGHADDVVCREEIVKLADRNTENINRYLEEIVELLEKPLTKEELLENLIILNDLSMNFKQYHLNFSAMSAMLAFLYNKEKVTYSIENGRLYYYRYDR